MIFKISNMVLDLTHSFAYEILSTSNEYYQGDKFYGKNIVRIYYPGHELDFRLHDSELELFEKQWAINK